MALVSHPPYADATVQGWFIGGRTSDAYDRLRERSIPHPWATGRVRPRPPTARPVAAPGPLSLSVQLGT